MRTENAERITAEVYVAHATGPRLVMVFDEECRIWRRWLAETFGKAFIRADKSANGGKSTACVDGLGSVRMRCDRHLGTDRRHHPQRGLPAAPRRFSRRRGGAEG